MKDIKYFAIVYDNTLQGECKIPCKNINEANRWKNKKGFIRIDKA
jgi:hypothetical protein